MKMKLKNWFAMCALVLCLTLNSFGQESATTKQQETEKDKDSIEADSHFWSNSKEVGFNVTPLVSKLIPFNIGDKSSGFIGIKTKFYGENYAFRLTFGSDISNQTFNFFHFGIGYERRRLLVKKFTYTSGWQTLLESSSEDTGNSNNVILGATKFYGLEYNINETFFVGTEAQLVLGASIGGFNGGVEIQFRSPIAIFANVRLHNN